MKSTLSREVKRLVSNGFYSAALELYKLHIHPSAFLANTSILPSVIRACASAPSTHYPFGLQLHCVALKSGSTSDAVVSNSIISMYSKFSRPEPARRVFDEMPSRDPITRNALINCYLQNGCLRGSLEALREMCLHGFFPRPELVAGIVSACGRSGNIRLGKQIHARILFDPRSEGSVLLSTALFHMYLRCHDSWTGFRLFDRMPTKNEVSWTALVSGCISNNEYEMAISCLREMQDRGLSPNRVTLICLLQACPGLASLQLGKEIHGYAIRHGFDSEDHFSAALLHMYCECGEGVNRSRAVFNSYKSKDVVSWSSMIRSYARTGEADSAIELFSHMRIEGVGPNSVTLLAVISACTAMSSLILGQSVHGYLIKSGLNTQEFVENSLIDMYCKCGCLQASCQIFNEMAEPDLVSWSALIAAYGLHGHGQVALELFHEMKDRSIEPDGVTLLSALSACNHAGFAEEGQKLFKDAVKENKIPINSEHYSCFVDLLGKSGQLTDACEVIKTMPVKPTLKVWTSLVSACKAQGRLDIAEKLVHQLIKAEPKNPSNNTLLSMVRAERSDWAGVEDVRRLMRGQGPQKHSGISRIDLLVM
ncbi:pentatricopeptide repeat-containing protein At4g31070, mitochondrial [Punica granatum]|uniref:Uncharacterized protein n=2 Tax=Punica granatum TaxID=22663 RepID=A0A218XVP0_PUNGR|nr:pentatricopeptide repeat-containing protein At4g31070, mitochondrial [Punica granatum]OWM89235.1 hypothetical protein CDL15_Pgr010522 [Punica granatum]PKI67787.1 hypothetical protein CRG98_011837 [Punica granatum]